MPDAIKVWKFDDCDYVAGTDLQEALRWYYELTGERIEVVDEVQNLDAPDQLCEDGMTWRESINDMLARGAQPPMIIGTDPYYA